MPDWFHALVAPRRDWRAWVWLSLAALWFVFVWDDVTGHPNQPSRLGVSYLWIGLPPVLLFAAQGLYPTRGGWALLLVLTAALFVWLLADLYPQMLELQEGVKRIEGREAGFVRARTIEAVVLGLFFLAMWPRGAPPRHEEAA